MLFPAEIQIYSLGSLCWTGWQSFWWLMFPGIPIFYYWIRSRSTSVQRIKAIPGPTPLPILGNILDLVRLLDKNFVKKVFIDWVNQYGSIISCWIGLFPVIILSSPETVKVILSSSKHITKGIGYTFFRSWLGNSVLMATGDQWNNRRRLLTPAFHFGILNRFMDIFNERSLECAKEIEEAIGDCGNNGKEIDICPIVFKCALDIICESSMGRRSVNEKEKEIYFKNVNRYCEINSQRVFYPWFTYDWSFRLTALSRECSRCIKSLHKFTKQVIRDRQNFFKQKSEKLGNATSEVILYANNNYNDEDCQMPKKRLAFLDLLIEASDNGTVISDEEIRQEVDLMMFAGHDTTASTMSWFLYLIAKHPIAQQLATEELNSVFGDSDRPCTSSDAAQLKYLECCIKETLRLYPVGPMVFRSPEENVTIEKYTIPASVTIGINIYGIHHNPQYYPDPESFKPERFFPENSKGRHPYAFIPFSAGPRNCIGQKYAMIEMKVVLGNLLRRFRFSVADLDQPMITPSVDAMLLTPKKDGLYVTVSNRK